MTQPSDMQSLIVGLIDINKSLVRICNNIELVTAMMVNETVLEDIGVDAFSLMSKNVLEMANILKTTIRDSRREGKSK